MNKKQGFIASKSASKKELKRFEWQCALKREVIKLKINGFKCDAKLHQLKIDIEAIDLKIRGIKNWEIRYDHRGYKVCD